MPLLGREINSTKNKRAS